MNALHVAKTMISEGANGPGRRLVVWVAGCNLACPGCINPWSHNPDGPHRKLGMWELWDLCHIARDKDGVVGLTITGGEPWQQDLEALNHLVSAGQRAFSDVGVFTGYTLHEIASINPDSAAFRLEILKGIDWMVTGRYRRDLPPGGPMCSSSNQSLVLLSGKHTFADFETRSEVVFDLDAAQAVKTGTLHGK